MHGLLKVLATKIVITVLIWALPLLLFPKDLLVCLGFPAAEPEIFLRLLGMAYAALVVSYVLGFSRARRNDYPVEAVWVGIVSNGGATVVLAIGAFMGTWFHWGAFAQVYMWFSLASVALITVGLVIQGPCKKGSRDVCVEAQSNIDPESDEVRLGG